MIIINLYKVIWGYVKYTIKWIRHLIKTYRQAIKSKISGSIWAGSFSAWVTSFGIGTVNTTFHHENGILACLLFGLYLSYARILKNIIAFKNR